MRSFIYFLAVILAAFFCETSGIANTVSQQKSGDASRAAQEVAGRMAERLSKQLPRHLSSLSTEQSSQQSKRESDQSADTTSGPASGQTAQAKTQQGERPRLQLPEDKPLGAAGPSRDKRKPDIEDADFMVIRDRWRIGMPEDPRFRKGDVANPYRQNVLKGDYPIIGNHTFLNITLASESAFNIRRVPVPQDVSSARPGSFEFFGRGRQEAFNQNFIFSADIFHGDASFKPVDWRFKVTGVANLNLLRAREVGIVNIDVREGRSRLDGFNAIEELFFEYRLGDTTKIMPFLRGKGSRDGDSPFFDTTSVRVGIQPFTSDFRGFIFSDSNLGARLFGNFGANRWQYNLAYFDMLEKETNSELNTINPRDLEFRNQKVYIANIFRQDTFVLGYTTQFSLHYSDDRPTTEYDQNGFLVRPARLGDIRRHRVRSGYFGWTGDGHFGRWNITHALYQAIGRDSYNQLAARATRINAQMAAAELSIDFDWIRYRVAGFYTSGDSKPTDGTARGFDAILDNPNFAGGPFSFWNSQGIRLTQTGVALVEPRSLIPSLRSSKIQGQSNFVNPGLTLYNAGIDVDVTPKLRGFINYNYLRFNRTEPLELALFQNSIRHEIGHDLGIGFIYRPLLNENIVLIGGASGLRPGVGFTDIYSSNCNGTPQGCGAGSPTLWSAFLKLRFVY